jgi:hypothetical protein
VAGDLREVGVVDARRTQVSDPRMAAVMRPDVETGSLARWGPNVTSVAQSWSANA